MGGEGVEQEEGGRGGWRGKERREEEVRGRRSGGAEDGGR